MFDERRARLGGPAQWPPARMRELLTEEVWTSTAMAGSTLTLDDVKTLLALGTTGTERPLDDYVAVADYAEAAAYSRSATRSSRHAFLRLDELVELHARALCRTPGARAGTWRTTTAPPFVSGAIAPPAWLVPREMDAFAERFSAGPGERHALPWLADAHARLMRIHPFIRGNGRTARLVTNLLARRLELPPLSVRSRDTQRYVAALQRAESRDPWPLALLFARTQLESVDSLLATREGTDALEPLGALAEGADLAALYKAAQRGRLRILRRAGMIYTTGAWIVEYERSRAHAGRPRSARTALKPRDARPI
ncbi:MAG: Fic family protein [Candidatus Eremiobacteraeota bacterium]|nr:Fic family protein [Candidatus Eremiobacteraeota bacterium]